MSWVPNFGIQEWMHHAKEIDDVIPYSPKQLPIARLEDGSMWDW